MREREMTRSMRNRGRTLRGIALFSLLLIPALLVGCKNKGSDGSKGPSTGATITGTAQNGVFRLSVNINPNTIPPGGSAGITVLATTVNGAPLDGQNVQMATSGGTIDPVAGKTDAAGKFVTKISIEETFKGLSVDVSAIVQGLTAKATLFINEPGALKIDPGPKITLAPGDSVNLTCVGGVEPVRWEATGGTLNRHNERTVIYTAGSLTGTFFAKCTDAGNNSASVEIIISLTAGGLTINPSSDQSLRPGQTIVFQATGGRPPYSWSFPAEGGSLSSTTGATITLTAGSTKGDFFLLLTDSAGGTKSVKITITPLALAVSPPSAQRSFTVATTPAPQAPCTFASFSVTFTITGGVPPYLVSTDGISTISPVSPSGTFTYTNPGGSMPVGSTVETITVQDSVGSTPVNVKVTLTCTISG